MAVKEATKTETPDLGVNKEYEERKIEVDTRTNRTGFTNHIGTVGSKIIKTVRIEPRRAKQMNRTWHTRKLIYLEVGKPIPQSINRTMDEETGDWIDTVIE